MEQFEKVNAYFEPKNLETLHYKAKQIIGKLLIFDALWIIDEHDGGPYVGQWAMRISDENNIGDLPFVWVPEEDIRIVKDD